MNIAWYALWFIVAVSLLVTVHEYGHFWVARRLGFKVLRFSVGFGKPLIEREGRDGTIYSVAMLPLGGYVKLLDEREGPVPPEELHRAFTRKPPWQRILVLLAGPAFNIVFAIVVLWGMLWFRGETQDMKAVVGQVLQTAQVGEQQAPTPAALAGLRSGDLILSIDGEPVAGRRDVVFGLLDSISANGSATLTVRGSDDVTRTVTLSVGDGEARRRLTEPAALFRGLGFDFWSPPLPPVIGAVVSDGPAAKAGLRPGDRITAIGDKPIADFRDVLTVIAAAKPGDELLVQVARNGTEERVRVTLGRSENAGASGAYLGVRRVEAPVPQDMLVITKLNPVSALGLAAQEAWDMTVLQARLVWRMLMGNVSLKNLNGPLSIAEFAGESANDGASSFLQFLVLISLSLGFLNLLPIPILDGGQIVFQLAEWLKGSPLSERVQALGQQVGIALLILLMGVALYNDIVHQIG
jgi:regulator of sigma E protease